MREITAITIIFIFLLSGCNRQESDSEKLLDEVEKIIEVNPDSASAILKNVSSPERLNDKIFARWCMLSGKITDKIFNTILPPYQFERAYEWYASHGSPSEQAQILLYWGRSNAADGDYDKAMSIYTDALKIAGKNRLDNLAGYTYCYMGDLYQEKMMRTQALDKYITAANYFKKENNKDSYACALRDVGREYALLDSIPQALKVLAVADSIGENSPNPEVTASIMNTLGNVYIMQEDYEKAEKYLLKAFIGKANAPSYIALIDLYISTDSINKAKALLQEIPKNDPIYTSSINYLYYQIYKYEMNYKEALNNLEGYVDRIDSIINGDNQSKILNIEAKYNHLKTQQEINTLKIKEQSFIIISAVCTSALLLMIVVYLLYRKKAKEKIQKQQEELNKTKIELLNLSLELEKKKSQLGTFKEKNEGYQKLQNEIEQLSANYKKLQGKILLDSPMYKKLLHLSNQNIPGNNKPLITKEQWQLITNEIMAVYPNLYNYISNLCPNLPEQDFQYCCFYMYGFDTNAEAKLLNITLNSVRTKHSRLRQKLNVSLPNNTTLYEYLMQNMH